ncbi:MAG: hypothetical protein R3C05_23485 [Pirellulaceae bacterium]
MRAGSIKVSTSNLGYRTAATGYAAALLARLRGEESAQWSHLLRADAASTFKMAIRTMPAPYTMVFDAAIDFRSGKFHAATRRNDGRQQRVV